MPQAQDQLDQISAHCRPSRASLASPRSPLAPFGLAVPTEQRSWRDQESSPAFPREQPAEGSQEGAVDGPVLDAAVDLALEDSHLVTETTSSTSSSASQRRDDTTDAKIRHSPSYTSEKKGHGPMMTGIGSNCQLKDLIEIVAPFTSHRHTSAPHLRASVPPPGPRRCARDGSGRPSLLARRRRRSSGCRSSGSGRRP